MLSKLFNHKSFLVAAGLSIVIFPLPGVALPSKSIERTFYSDASKTEIVGTYFLGCSGGRKLIGRATPYYTTVADPCDGGGGPANIPVSCEFLESGCPLEPVF